MRDVLKRAIEQARRDIAQRFQDWIAEQREERDWAALITRPAGQAALERIGEQAREEYAHGATRDPRDIL